jgi:hypothetical protein
MGTIDKCLALLENTGLRAINIETASWSHYLSQEEAQSLWDNFAKNPLCIELLTMQPEQLAQVKQEYWQEMEKLVTDQGIWNENIHFLLVTGIRN